MTRPSSGPTARSAPRSSRRSCPTTRFDAAAVIPVADGGSVIGVAGLLWDTAESFGADRVDEITRLVQRVAPLLLRNAIGAEPDLDYWLDTLLHLHLDPWLLLEAIPRSDGMIGDFVVLDAAQQIVGRADWLGRRLLELWPSATRDGMLEGLVSLMRAGGAWTSEVSHESDAPWGTPGSRVRAVRLGQRIVLVWRPGRIGQPANAETGPASTMRSAARVA